jgi:hypothetical protein
MSREKEPKITISKEAALLISTKEECEKLLNAVKNAKYRAEKIIERRRIETGRLKEIQDNLDRRLEFLTIVPVIEPNTWYIQRGTHPHKDSCYVLSASKEQNVLSGWRFSIEENYVRRSWRNNDYVFLHPLNNQLITDPPMEKGMVVVDKHIEVSLHGFNLKGNDSFLLNWVPSSDLGVVVQDPDIIEVKGIIEDMWIQNSSRRLQKDSNDEVGKTTLHFVKHQKQWYLLLILE